MRGAISDQRSLTKDQFSLFVASDFNKKKTEWKENTQPFSLSLSLSLSLLGGYEWIKYL